MPAHETISTIRHEQNGGAHGRPSTRFEPVSVHLEGNLLTALCAIRNQSINPCTVKEVAGSNSQNYNHLPSIVLETISLSQRTVTPWAGRSEGLSERSLWNNKANTNHRIAIETESWFSPLICPSAHCLASAAVAICPDGGSKGQPSV